MRDRARNLRQRILDGDDFAALARELSAAPTASQAGDLGWIQEPSDYLIDSTLAPLMVGDVSPPVALDNGYLLLQLTDIEPSPQIPLRRRPRRVPTTLDPTTERGAAPGSPGPVRPGRS